MNEDQSSIIDEARKPRAVFYVPTVYFVSLFTRGFEKADYISFPEVSGLPKSAKAVSSFYDACRDAYGVIVEDDSFARVPPGVEIPMLHVDFQSRKVKTEPHKDQ